MRFTTLLNYQKLIYVCLFHDLITGFYYINLSPEYGRMEHATTITLALQKKRLTKGTSHPKPSALVNYSFLFQKSIDIYCLISKVLEKHYIFTSFSR